MREKFDSIHSPTNLPITLSDPMVQTLLKKAKITTPEWNCLYPSPGVCGKSSDFDITLTFRLLRTICYLSPPHTGWNNLPNDSDHSLESGLTRIKWYRNNVYGHSQNMEIPNAEFVDLWRKISEALLRIAASISLEKRNHWKNAIEKFLHEPLTPEAERYAEELKLWYEKDLDVKKGIEGLHQEVRGLREDVRQAIVLMQLTVERIVQDGLLTAPGTRHMLPQLPGVSEGMCTVPIPLEQEQTAGAEVFSGERHGNQQERPTERGIWDVIFSVKNSFDSFKRYLENRLNVFVRRYFLGSLSIIVECSSLQILEGLWVDYSSGHLNKVAQETMVTDEVLKKIGLDEVKLKTLISEEEYEKGKQTFRKNSAPSQQSRALEREAVSGDQVESQEAGLATPIEKETLNCSEKTLVTSTEKKLSSQDSDHAPSEQSTVFKEQMASKSQGQICSGSILEDQATATKKEKNSKPKKCDSAAQVILVSGKVITKETLYFDPTTGKLVIVKKTTITDDKVIALDMNKAVTGGGFFGFASVFNSSQLPYRELYIHL